MIEKKKTYTSPDPVSMNVALHISYPIPNQSFESIDLQRHISSVHEEKRRIIISQPC